MADLLTSTQIATLKQISLAAGQAIMDVYQQSDFGIQEKADNSPLTQADLAAHQIITAGLIELDADIPQLSEEAADIPFSERQSWQHYWCIDPLDGTKEFINRNGDFTVNIALINDGKPVFGMIYLPVDQELYWGGPEYGAFKQQQDQTVVPIKCREIGSELTVVASRRHGEQTTEKLLSQIRDRYTEISLVNRGSSLKMCMIAEGNADIYPRLFPTSEWDTAASQAIIEAAGGLLVNAETLQPLRYNQRESLVNPFFIVIGDRRFPLDKLNLSMP